MTFIVDRTETVRYWIEYDRQTVIDLMAQENPSARAEYDAMSDRELAEQFQDELREPGAVFDAAIEDSERHGDVSGNELRVSVQEPPEINWRDLA